MIKPLLISLLFLFSINGTLTAQNFYGMIKVDTNLWMDQTEITNNEYRQFVFWVRDSIEKKIGNDIYLESKMFYTDKILNTDTIIYSYTSDDLVKTIKVYPDTTTWEKLDTLRPPFKHMEMYFYHPAYDNYPVVGVSMNQALAFCHWRSKLLNEFNTNPNNKKATGITVKYDLPSADQWSKVAYKDSSLLPSGLNLESDLNKEEQNYFKEYGLLINSIEYKYPHQEGKGSWHYTMDTEKTYGIGLPSLKKTRKKSNSIQGLAGNVAEMTKNGGALGGSWYHPTYKAKQDEQIQIKPEDTYPWLGFRCIVKVIE